jgi:uncharacterized integral membrane protein (TIGR00697 family)
MEQRASATLVPSLWFLALVGLFIGSLLAANVIAVKVIEVTLRLGALALLLILPAGIVVFPLSYIVADVLTEVYGYSATRRVIWVGFLANLLFVVAAVSAGALPAAPFWPHQEAFSTILGYTPRLLVASFSAYLVGEFVNSFILAKLKVVTGGRWLWSRTISSTLVGEGLDTLIFITLAFAGTMAGGDLLRLILTHWLVKCGYEAIATPLIYVLANGLKQVEKLDTFDTQTDFNPLAIGR